LLATFLFLFIVKPMSSLNTLNKYQNTAVCDSICRWHGAQTSGRGGQTYESNWKKTRWEGFRREGFFILSPISRCFFLFVIRDENRATKAGGVNTAALRITIVATTLCVWNYLYGICKSNKRDIVLFWNGNCKTYNSHVLIDLLSNLHLPGVQYVFIIF